MGVPNLLLFNLEKYDRKTLRLLTGIQFNSVKIGSVDANGYCTTRVTDSYLLFIVSGL